MKERPIIFSGAMVRAILEGRKTQTRRALQREKMYGPFAFDDPRIARYCPYGGVGDRLWVRETWAEGVRTTLYRATDGDMLYWKPSIHMPRGRSRITLEITDVRVERLWEISEDDARAEGVTPAPHETYRDAYMRLWDTLNAKRGYGWAVNPWVWVISFRRLNESAQ